MNKRTWLIVIGFSLLQLVFILFPLNGPSADEALYIKGGVYLLDGGDIYQTIYLSLFNGSPFVWPIFAGLGFQFGGLMGARLMALGFVLLTLIMVAQATANLFGKTAAMWTVLMLSVNAHIVHLGHLVVYDIPALAFLSISFWSITQYQKNPRRVWVLVAAIASALATLAKYAFGVMLPVILILLLMVSAKRMRINNALLYLGVSGTLVSAYMLYFFQSLVPSSLTAYSSNDPGYLVVFIFQFAYTVIPFSFAIVGYLTVQPQQSSHLPKVLLGALFIWPLLHILTNNDVSGHKHVVIGYLFAYPLVGLAMEKLWQSKRYVVIAALLAGLVVWGGAKLFVQRHTWVDVRPAAIYLSQHVAAGDQIFNFHGIRWIEVYLNNVAHRDVDVVYADRLDIDISTSDLCTYQWIVNNGHDDNTLRSQVLSEKPCKFTLVFSADVFDVARKEDGVGLYWETFDVYRVSERQQLE